MVACEILSGGFCGNNKRYFIAMYLMVTPMAFKIVNSFPAILADLREVTVDPSLTITLTLAVYS